MAAAATLDPAQNIRNHHFGTISLGSSYTTGGVAITPSTVGFSNAIEHLDIAQSGGYLFEWLPASSKVKAFWSGTAGATLNEVTNGTNLSAVTPRFMAVGY